MYTIKGQDQKEYGPVDAAQILRWITEGRVVAQSLLKPEGSTEWRPLGSFPEFMNAAPPPVMATFRPIPPPDNTLATLIPYKNGPALLAYYLGIFSFIPIVGFFLGVPAFIAGIMGLKRARLYPETKGKVHAWIGIVFGGFFTLLYLVAIVAMIAGAMARPH